MRPEESSRMAYWLFKEEPDHYSLEDLFRDKRSVWAGVENNLALKHLRSVQKGDRVLYYHTGKEKAVVGVMFRSKSVRQPCDLTFPPPPVSPSTRRKQ